jgi:hypothetical protein
MTGPGTARRPSRWRPLTSGSAASFSDHNGYHRSGPLPGLTDSARWTPSLSAGHHWHGRGADRRRRLAGGSAANRDRPARRRSGPGPGVVSVDRALPGPAGPGCSESGCQSRAGPAPRWPGSRPSQPARLSGPGALLGTLAQPLSPGSHGARPFSAPAGRPDARPGCRDKPLSIMIAVLCQIPTPGRRRRRPAVRLLAHRR